MKTRAVINKIARILVKIDTWVGVPTVTEVPQAAPLLVSYQYLNWFIPR